MKVLLSIKPEFATKIFEGSKKYEYRRSIFKRNDVTTIVVYASDPVKKVIGEFEIGGIIQDKPLKLWEQTGEHAGISKELFLNYFKDKNCGYAIKVKNTKFYETPFLLDRLMVSYPPQSFLYL
jgi:predicted transcriptional regulator